MVDLQALNAAQSDVLRACRSAVFTSLGPGQMYNCSFGSQSKTFGKHCYCISLVHTHTVREYALTHSRILPRTLPRTHAT